MKRYYVHAVLILLTPLVYKDSYSQTYNIAANTNWSSLGIGSPCNGCIFNISAGVTLTLDATATCNGCLFSGGIVQDNSKFTWQGGTFSFDSVVFNNSSATLQVNGVGGAAFNNSKVEFEQGITCQACGFNGDKIYLNLPTAASKVTFQSAGSFNTEAISNSTVTVNQGQWYANITTTVTNSTMTFYNSSNINNNTGVFTMSNSKLNLYGNSYVSTSTGFTIQNNSWITVGDGPLTSGAYFFDNSGTNFTIKDNSGMGIANQNNYYSNWGNYTYVPTSGSNSIYSTLNLNYNCGAGHPNSCSANIVYGCATFNSVGPASCTTLAVSGVTLKAAPASGGMELSWTDLQNNSGGSYLIQRSNGNGDWTDLSSVNADDLSSGDYSYEDRTAPAGTVNYRIARTDHDGNVIYSTVASVSVNIVHHTVGVFPNPVTGHTFYLTVPATSQLVLNIYTLTGQLLLRTSLRGQTQYSVTIPAQVSNGTTVVVQTVLADQTVSFPLLLR